MWDSFAMQQDGTFTETSHEQIHEFHESLTYGQVPQPYYKVCIKASTCSMLSSVDDVKYTSLETTLD